MKYLSLRFYICIVFCFSFLCTIDSNAQVKRNRSRKTRNSNSIARERIQNNEFNPMKSPMRFTLYQGCGGSGCPLYILAEGVFTPETPELFANFLKTLKNVAPDVYFNSPGGSLSAGMKIGQIIRNVGYDTYVGSNYTKYVNSDHDEVVVVRHGICASACSYAFMGGIRRTIDEGGNLGIHQFYSQGGKSTESNTQITMAVLANYLDEMGISRKVLDIASVTGSNEITVLPLKIAQKFNLDNNNPPLEEWKLDTYQDGQLSAYLIQQQPGRNALVGFFLRRQKDYIILTIRYLIKQKFRKPNELREIFSSENVSELNPTFCVLDASEECGIEAPFKTAVYWQMKDTQTAVTTLVFTHDSMDLLTQGKTILYDAGFPHVYYDVNPRVKISTKNLERV